MASRGNSTKHEKVVIQILLKLFHKIKEEGTLPKTFYEATITLIPKPDQRYYTKKEIYKPVIFGGYGRKSSQQNFSRLNPTTLKRPYTTTKWDSYQFHKDVSTYTNQSHTPH